VSYLISQIKYTESYRIAQKIFNTFIKPIQSIEHPSIQTSKEMIKHFTQNVKQPLISSQMFII